MVEKSNEIQMTLAEFKKDKEEREKLVESLDKALETMYVNIAPKDKAPRMYLPVHARLWYFRSAPQYMDFRLVTKMERVDLVHALFVAEVYDQDDKLVANGTAHEQAEWGFINKENFVENCETSAIGRALANLGIGVKQGIATVEDVKRAETRQKSASDGIRPATEKQVALINKLLITIEDDLTRQTIEADLAKGMTLAVAKTTIESILKMKGGKK